MQSWKIGIYISVSGSQNCCIHNYADVLCSSGLGLLIFQSTSPQRLLTQEESTGIKSARPSSQSLTPVTYGATKRLQDTAFRMSHLVLLKTPPRKTNTRSSLCSAFHCVNSKNSLCHANLQQELSRWETFPTFPFATADSLSWLMLFIKFDSKLSLLVQLCFES